MFLWFCWSRVCWEFFEFAFLCVLLFFGTDGGVMVFLLRCIIVVLFCAGVDIWSMIDEGLVSVGGVFSLFCFLLVFSCSFVGLDRWFLSLVCKLVVLVDSVILLLLWVTLLLFASNFLLCFCCFFFFFSQYTKGVVV